MDWRDRISADPNPVTPSGGSSPAERAASGTASRAAGMTAAALLCLAAALAVGADERPDFSPRPHERQVPRAMHSAMQDRPRITVGVRDADIVGADNRALQAAVDYIAGLGGGT